jgi:WD40 repeat protein
MLAGVLTMLKAPQNRPALSNFGLICLVSLFGGDSSAQAPLKLDRQDGVLLSLAFSPDGKMLASTTNSKYDAIKLWEVATGKELRMLDEHPGMVGIVVFTPDGKQLISVGAENAVKVWDLASFKVIRSFKVRRLGYLALTPDGKTLIVCGLNEVVASLYDLATGQEVAVLKDNPTAWRKMALSPDGKFLATGDKEGTVTVWELATRKQLYSFLTERAFITEALAFSPDSKRLFVSGSSTRPLLIAWDIQTGQEKGRMRPSRDLRDIKAIAFTPDGRRLVLAGRGPTKLLLWDADEWKSIPEFNGEGHDRITTIGCIAVSADGKTLATGGIQDKRIILWKLPPPKPKE